MPRLPATGNTVCRPQQPPYTSSYRPWAGGSRSQNRQTEKCLTLTKPRHVRLLTSHKEQSKGYPLHFICPRKAPACPLYGQSTLFLSLQTTTPFTGIKILRYAEKTGVYFSKTLPNTPDYPTFRLTEASLPAYNPTGRQGTFYVLLPLSFGRWHKSFIRSIIKKYTDFLYFADLLVNNFHIFMSNRLSSGRRTAFRTKNCRMVHLDSRRHDLFLPT